MKQRESKKLSVKEANKLEFAEAVEENLSNIQSPSTFRKIQNQFNLKQFASQRKARATF